MGNVTDRSPTSSATSLCLAQSHPGAEDETGSRVVRDHFDRAPQVHDVPGTEG